MDSHELRLRVHPLMLQLLPLPHEVLLLHLALGLQPLRLHMLLHRHTDSAGGALALLVMFEQLPRRYAPAACITRLSGPLRVIESCPEDQSHETEV